MRRVDCVASGPDSPDEAYCGNLTWAKIPPAITASEPIPKGLYDTPMMERGQYVELNPDYR